MSSASITVNGVITANAGLGGCGVGNAGCGGHGSGGVVHLISPTVTGTGTVETGYGTNTGVIDVAATTNSFHGTLSGPTVLAGLYNPPLPSGVPAVQVTSVNSVPAPANPAANPMTPDVTINSSTPVTVAIATQNIPVSTTVTLYLTAENAPDRWRPAERSREQSPARRPRVLVSTSPRVLRLQTFWQSGRFHGRR